MRYGSSNPAMEKGFNSILESDKEGQMTVSGSVVKTLILLAVLAVSFIWSYAYVPFSYGTMMIVSILTLVIAMITTFKPEVAKFTAIIYSAFEGLFLGSISNLFDQYYNGIAVPAILLTIVCVAVTMLVYGKNPSIADKTRKGVMIGLITILVTSLVSMVLGFFGVSVPIYGNGAIGIGFSVIVVILATVSLMQDYDFIVKGSRMGAPKYMEWYGAFGLMVTLVWLYLEILQLLAKLVSDND